ncbi:uncharacterized protein BCR38DRAFT_189494 [Pseudomassariella vexata]|uniref:Uncharacterized protein n=1 Tax=Pseudomassariella vexata TaxID=1141098 RepID=A0A1Y2E0L7_9PEZI|nr:uncharacterized protein BCR38DRAFT_189494 [Pseudomassariella vexata]ORY65019.1 hypothetical protein BCR38DRAFT_189494 [Pseudomassariella vexata]
MMRGLLKAALWLTPALARAFQDNPPSAFIRLDLATKEDDSPRETSLRLSVLESAESCGYGNVTLNGHSLIQDDAGIGSGSITTDQGNIIVASWTFSCVDSETNHQEQALSLKVDFIDSKQVEGLGFTVQFQQTSPTWVTYIEGAESVIKAPKLVFPSKDFKNKDVNNDLENEIAELEYMKMQLVELEQAIFMKEQFLAEAFGFHDKISKVTDCDNLKCIFLSVYDSVKGAASKVYGEGFDFGDRHHRHHGPYRGFGKGKHGKKPHGFSQDHNNRMHGNETSPHPPHHGKAPPFCHCPPPPHHGFEHGGPPFDHHHGPPDERFPFHHPHHGPPGEEPPFGHPHHGPPGEEPPFDHPHHGPPGEESPFGHPHHGPPGEEPPFGHPHHDPPGEEPPFDHQGPPGGEPDFNHPPPADYEARPEGPYGNIPPPPPPRESEREHPLHLTQAGDHPPPPPPPGGEHPPPPPPPDGRHGPPHHVHGHPHGPPPPFDLHQFAASVSVFRVLATVIVLGFLLSILHTRCITSRRNCARRQERYEQRIVQKTRLMKLLKSLKNLLAGRNAEDEEKDAIMRQIGQESDEDSLPTTMEEEIAQFRSAAGVVGDMVAAEEGRAREMLQCQRQHAMPRAIPSSPISPFLDYMSVDEALPAYDDTTEDSSYVADGMRGGSRYTPSDSSVAGSLDDVLGRKD